MKRPLTVVALLTLLGASALAPPAATGEAQAAAGAAASRDAQPAAQGDAAGKASAPTAPGGQPGASPPPAVALPHENLPPSLPPDMARYYMVFLRRSGKPAPPPDELRKIMDGHMANIRRLAGEHKLLLAGPFMDQSGPGSLAGIFVLAAASLDEARQLCASDPAVAAGRFTVEVVPWLGPKTLSRVLEP